MISPSSTNVEVTKKGDYIFRVCFIDSYQGKALATFARQTLKARDGGAPRGLARATTASASPRPSARPSPALGGRVIAESKYAEGDSDFSAQLTAIRPLAAGRPRRPRLLHRRGTDRAAGAVARDPSDAARRGRLGLPEADGDRRRGGRGRVLLEPLLRGRPVAGRARVRRRLPPRYGADPDSIAALSYDAARLIADAMRRAGSTEGKRVRDALAATKDFPGVTGKITMDADRNPSSPRSSSRSRAESSVSPRTIAP